jgi:hypothetical protein
MIPRRPSIGEPNLAALIAAVIGCMGGLFALGIAPAIITRSPQYLAAYPKLNVISFFLCGSIGWLIGGQIGPRLEKLCGLQPGMIVGGIAGGLLPVGGIVALGWYLCTH